MHGITHDSDDDTGTRHGEFTKHRYALFICETAQFLFDWRNLALLVDATCLTLNAELPRLEGLGRDLMDQGMAGMAFKSNMFTFDSFTLTNIY